MTDIEKQVWQAVVRHAGAMNEADRNPPRVPLEADLREDLGLDSLDRVGAAMELEHECGIEIGDEAIEGLRTVGDLVRLVRERSGKKEP